MFNLNNHFSKTNNLWISSLEVCKFKYMASCCLLWKTIWWKSLFHLPHEENKYYIKTLMVPLKIHTIFGKSTKTYWPSIKENKNSSLLLLLEEEEYIKLCNGKQIKSDSWWMKIRFALGLDNECIWKKEKRERELQFRELLT